MFADEAAPRGHGQEAPRLACRWARRRLFVVPFVFADGLRLPRDVYYGIYVAAVLGFFVLWARATGQRFEVMLRRRWRLAVVLGVIFGLVLGFRRLGVALRRAGRFKLCGSFRRPRHRERGARPGLPALSTRGTRFGLLRLMILHELRCHRRKAEVATATCAQGVDVDLCLPDQPVIGHVL